jgi:hypothetical protein
MHGLWLHDQLHVTQAERGPIIVRPVCVRGTVRTKAATVPLHVGAERR